MSAAAGGGHSWVVGESDRVPTTEWAGVQAMPSLGPPWHLFVPAQEPAPAPGQSASVLHGPPLFVPALQVWLQTGHDWMPGAFGNRSPVRKSSELSGRLRFEAPVTQSAEPLASAATVLMTHTLIGVVAEFGIGSGGPHREPAPVQFRVLPVWVEEGWRRVSVVPLHDAAGSELPMSGAWDGSRPAARPPPGYG